MSQVFSCDAQMTESVVHVPTNTETVVLKTKPLQVPYQTAKAKVLATLNLQSDPDASFLAIAIYSDYGGPDQNKLCDISINTVTDVSNYILMAGVVDEIPDSRQVTYTVTVKQSFATGDAQIPSNAAYLEATLISG